MSSPNTPFDLLIIGGGINGCGIARDAAGRGLSVCLVERDDLAQATSSASTKLFHGGLRYLEYFEFRLVKEALEEREVLLKAMPHISWPMRFVLPLSRDMRFDKSTPTSRLLKWVMPWMRGRRPDWLIRLGLLFYDHVGGRKILPATRILSLSDGREGAPLKSHFTKAYEYSDCWVEDSRLVVLNAQDAKERGADIRTRVAAVSAEVRQGVWHVRLSDGNTVQAKALVNAGGPFVEEIIQGVTRQNTSESIRLVRGSHIVTKKLYDHDKSYFFQGSDGRIIFAIPYETDFTLIGTTDADHEGSARGAKISDEEITYLCDFANQYFEKKITPADVIWTFAGVRPLYDDGASSAQAATRDYVLSFDQSLGAPVLNIFGGKITTYRKLAQSALKGFAKHFPNMGTDWTAQAALPGGDFPHDGFEVLTAQLTKRFPFLNAFTAKRLIRAYGTRAFVLMQEANSQADLGRDYGAGLTERELDWLYEHEWARSAEDVIWRRSKLGLRLTHEQVHKIQAWFETKA